MPITKIITKTTYDNGAQEIVVNGLVTFIRYDNGDQVYFDEAGKVWSIETYNGLSFTYHYPSLVQSNTQDDKMKSVWVMSGKSESGDDYYHCANWDHQPSQEEIDRVRIELDSEDFDRQYHDKEDDGYVVVDDREYIVYILEYSIGKIDIPS